MIQSGIDHLLGHSDPACVDAGENAQARMDATDYGFRSGNQIYDTDMYVRMRPSPTTYCSSPHECRPRDELSVT